MSEFVVSQVAGHERGETMSGKRYASDGSPDLMTKHIGRLNFSLPTIVPLDVPDAIAAMAAALGRKLSEN